MSKMKEIKVLVIDHDRHDWTKVFEEHQEKNGFKFIVDQAEWSQLNLEAFYDSSNVILSIKPNKTPQKNTNQHKPRYFQPDFVLIRGLVQGIKPGQDWRNILYGFSFANVPCVNSVDSLINGQERAHVIGKMKQLEKKHGKKKFPLIQMNYYSETKSIQFTPDFPVVVKVGSFEAGFGKMKIYDTKQLSDLGSILTVYDDYVTVEKFIENRDYDIRIQKIGKHYRAYKRISMVGNWKTNVGNSIVEPIKMESQFKFWIDECSKIFGGLDILTVDAVHTKNDEYFILEINDCSSGFLPENQLEDMEHMKERLVIGTEVIYSDLNFVFIDLVVSCSSFGGDICCFSSDDHWISIFSQNGKFIQKFQWNNDKEKGEIVFIDFNESNKLIVITKIGNYFVLDIFGTLINKFQIFSDERVAERILVVKKINHRMLIFRNDHKVFSINNLDLPQSIYHGELKFKQIPNEISCVFKKDHFIMLFTNYSSIYMMKNEDCKELELGPQEFTHFAVSEDEKQFAAYCQNSQLFVWNTEFHTKPTQIPIDIDSPLQTLTFFETDVIVLFFRNGILMFVHPNTEIEQFQTEKKSVILKDEKCIRVLSNSQLQIFYPIPRVNLEIEKEIDTPASILFHSFKQYQNHDIASIQKIQHLIKDGTIKRAIDDLFECSLNEMNLENQKEIFDACVFGKGFYDEYPHVYFIDFCNRIRLLNSLRHKKFGIPITNQQYQLINSSFILKRLISRREYNSACFLTNFWGCSNSEVVVDWACNFIKSDADDDEIYQEIISKSLQGEIDFSKISKASFEFGKKELSLKILNHEINLKKQIFLLIEMKEYALALIKSTEKKNSRAIGHVIEFLEKNLNQSQFFALLDNVEDAKRFFIKLNQSKQKKLINFFNSIGEYDSVAYLYLKGNSLASQEIKRNFEKSNSKFEEHCINSQIKLFEQQQNLNEIMGKDLFSKKTVHETVYLCFIFEQKEIAFQIKNEFEISDKKFCWIQLQAYSKIEEWLEIEKISIDSPIGYSPFVDICLEKNKSSECMKYIPKLTNIKEMVEAYVEIRMFKEAIEIAFSERDVELLIWISSKTTNKETKKTISKLKQHLEFEED
eukprot:gene2538-3500_t